MILMYVKSLDNVVDELVSFIYHFPFFCLNYSRQWHLIHNRFSLIVINLFINHSVDFETQVLGVNPKQPEALVVRSFSANQVNAGMLPEQWSEKSRAPLKSISFEHLKLQPELYEVEPGNFLPKYSVCFILVKFY